MVTSAVEEILIVFPTVNAFHRLEKDGFIQLVQRAARRGVRVRILTPFGDRIKESVQSLNEMFDQLDARSFGLKQEAKSTIMISDAKFSLVIDLNDDNKDNSIEANGLASYSN